MELLYSFRDMVVGPHLDERRAIPRATCKYSLSCQTPDGARVCTLVDISSQGARLITDQKWGNGASVLLVPPRGMEGKKAGVKAKVAWTRPVRGQYQTGLKFTAGIAGTWVSELLTELGLGATPPRQRRAWVRVQTDVKTNYTIHGVQKQGTLVDLSLGGALISGPERTMAGTPVLLSLAPGKDAGALELLGKVAHCRQEKTDFSISIKFESLSPPQKKLLVKHLSESMKRALGRF